jgi:DNA gyrase subunit A
VGEFKVQGRGGQGVIAIKTSERNGALVGALQAGEDDEIVLISSLGTLVRTPATDISIISRNTQGVTLIRLDKGDQLVGLDSLQADEELDDQE